LARNAKGAGKGFHNARFSGLSTSIQEQAQLVSIQTQWYKLVDLGFNVVQVFEHPDFAHVIDQILGHPSTFVRTATALT